MENHGTCEHELCNCLVDEDSQYCSDHCRDAVAADMTEIACDCSHPGCGL